MVVTHMVAYDNGAKERFECSIDNQMKSWMHLATYIAAVINKARRQEKRQADSDLVIKRQAKPLPSATNLKLSISGCCHRLHVTKI